ncbi:MAG: hypothetical protein JNG86_19430, partial [Verrucomicrobiaceae bacterium]|nr:hypothetical protein [Verrucomicrobiaceae bacterium]
MINLTANLTAAQIINLDVDATTGILNIGDPTTAFFGYTLQSGTGNTLTLDNSGAGAQINKAAAATASDIISAGLVLNDNLTFSNLNPNLTGQIIVTGPITETPGAKNIIVTGVAASSNGVTVLSGANGFTGSVTISSGTLAAVGATSLNSGAVNMINLSGGTLALRDNGSGYGNRQDVVFGDNVTLGGAGTISVDRTGTAGFPGSTALNKTIQLNDLTMGANTLTVNNLNGYGLEFTGAVDFVGGTFVVLNPTTANTSNIVPGLELSGALIGLGGINIGTGGGTAADGGIGGTVLLSNSGNTFLGDATIVRGVLAATSDGALGDLGNQIQLTATGAGAVATFRAADNITTARTINFNNATAANNVIEVVQGKTMTVNSPFGTAANGFVKGDNGLLDIAVSNVGFTGAVTVNAGAIQLSNSSALDTAVVSVPGVFGAAINLNNVSVANNLVINSSTTNVAAGGINFGGQLRGVSGTSTATGVVRMDADAAIGVAGGGAILNINGGINNPTTTVRTLLFNADAGGTINVNSNITSATTPTANQYVALRKYGAGTLNFTTANSVIPTDAAGLQILGGTLALTGAGTLTGGNTI